MKKLIILLLCACLCLSLFAGCGGDKDSIGSNIADAAPAPEAEPTPEAESEEEDKPPSAGTVSGSIYTNEFIGVKCDLGDDWMYFDEAQMAELNGLTAELFDDEQLQSTLENSGLVYDMYAMCLDGTATINIIIEDLGKLYGALLSEDRYVDISMDALPDALASAGFTDMSIEKTKLQFCGDEHSAIIISGMLEDMAIYEVLVCVKSGSYMAAITVASYIDNTTEDILKAFSAAE